MKSEAKKSSNLLSSIRNNRTILLVTDGEGFIGSSVVGQAVRDGHPVANLDALTYAACLDNAAPAANAPSYAFAHADIRDRAAYGHAIAEHGLPFVFGVTNDNRPCYLPRTSKP